MIYNMLTGHISTSKSCSICGAPNTSWYICGAHGAGEFSCRETIAGNKAHTVWDQSRYSAHDAERIFGDGLADWLAAFFMKKEK